MVAVEPAAGVTDGATDATRHASIVLQAEEKTEQTADKEAVENGGQQEKSTLSRECIKCLQMAWPLALANLIDRSSLWITLSFIGQEGGPAHLGPSSLASTVNNVLGVSVNIGLSLAVSTLASQASGAGDAAALGRVLQRGILIGVSFCIPVMLLLLLLNPIMLLLGRPPEFAEAAGMYGVSILPVAALTGMHRSMIAWLSSLQLTRPVLYINLVLLPVHAVLSYGLIFCSPLGYVGGGIATSLQAFLRSFLTYMYIRTSPRCAHAWRGFNWREMTSGWREYLAIGLPGVLLLSEFWVGEILVFSSAILPDASAALSALAIYQLTNATCYQIPAAVRVAVTARVGRALGAGKPSAATTTCRAGIFLVSLWLAMPSFALLLFTHTWGEIFTSDPAVVKLLSALVYWLVLYTGLDALLAVGAGALTGAARQKIGGQLAVICHVLIGLPAALALAFPAQLGVTGIAAGHTLGKMLMTAATFIAVLKTDWRRESETAGMRVRALSGSLRSDSVESKAKGTVLA